MPPISGARAARAPLHSVVLRRATRRAAPLGPPASGDVNLMVRAQRDVLRKTVTECAIQFRIPKSAIPPRLPLPLTLHRVHTSPAVITTSPQCPPPSTPTPSPARPSAAS